MLVSNIKKSQLTQSLGRSRDAFFSSSNLIKLLICEENERKAEQGSSQGSGLPQLTPFSDKQQTSYRLYRFLTKNGDVKNLADFLENYPSLAASLLKHLAQDPVLAEGNKYQCIAALSKSSKLSLSDLAKQNNFSEKFQQMIINASKQMEQKYKLPAPSPMKGG